MTSNERPQPDFRAAGQAYRVTGQSVEPIGQGHAASDAPWTLTGDRFDVHYDAYSQGPEHAEHRAAQDWAENGNPQNGDRLGEFFIQDGKLWNDGKYLAADGSAEPYVAWTPPAEAADHGRAR